MNNLADDIAEMFAELDGYVRYERALAEQAMYERTAAAERTRQWRIDNPKRYRAWKNGDRNRETTRAWRKANRAKVNAQRNRWTNKNRERARATWRRNQAAARARKLARKDQI